MTHTTVCQILNVASPNFTRSSSTWVTCDGLTEQSTVSIYCLPACDAKLSGMRCVALEHCILNGLLPLCVLPSGVVRTCEGGC